MAEDVLTPSISQPINQSPEHCSQFLNLSFLSPKVVRGVQGVDDVELHGQLPILVDIFIIVVVIGVIIEQID